MTISKLLVFVKRASLCQDADHCGLMSFPTYQSEKRSSRSLSLIPPLSKVIRSVSRHLRSRYIAITRLKVRAWGQSIVVESVK